jgi:hypothetical protein
MECKIYNVFLIEIVLFLSNLMAQLSKEGTEKTGLILFEKP